MEPENDEIQKEIERQHGLENRVSWARVLTLIGAVVCSFWLVYRVFSAHGVLAAFLAFILLSIVYKFGASPMFAVAASILCFHFKVVGLWLPVTSYVIGAILLYADMKRDNLQRRVSSAG
jgi:hypothetical protein